MKYIVGYIVRGQVVVEAESKDGAKEKVAKRLPTLMKGEDVIITAEEMTELEDQ